MYRTLAEQCEPEVVQVESRYTRCMMWFREHWPALFAGGIVLGLTVGAGMLAFYVGQADRDDWAARKACVDRGFEAIDVKRLKFGQRRVTCRLADGTTEIVVVVP